MKRVKFIHFYLDNISTKLSILLAAVLLVSLLTGCGTLLMRESEYKVAQLPKSSLATIKIDTDGQWIQRPNLIVFRIDGKLALRQKIDAYEELAIDEILVDPGKHEMSLLIIYESFHENTPSDRQILSRFSADVEAGSTYLLTGEFSHNSGGELNFKGKLVDSDEDEIVSKSKVFGQFSFDLNRENFK